MYNHSFWLTFEKSINKCHSFVPSWCPKASVIEQKPLKIPDVFLREKFFEFVLAIAKGIYFSVRMEKISQF
jgi:hypothetical protein